MSEVDDISKLALDATHQPVVIDSKDGRKFVALPALHGAYTLQQITLDNAAEVLQPKIVKQHVAIQTAASMADYVNRFQNDHTFLFADIANDSIVAIIDYHEQASQGPPAARLGWHRATLKLPKSLEWQTWSNVHDRLTSHRDFATFLEENSLDIIKPTGADLLERCRDLQVLSNVNFSSSVRMGDVTEFAYEKKSDATDRGGVAMPNTIELGIPVYFGEAKVRINAFVRRKIDEGKLSLGIALSRAENVRQDEFHRIVQDISEATGTLTTIYGTPA